MMALIPDIGFMSMEQQKYVGGRGQKVPYGSEMFRIPSACRPVIEALKVAFKSAYDSASDPKGLKLLQRVEDAITQPLKPDSGEDDDQEEDSYLDDQREPSYAEVEKLQARKIQELTVEVRMLEREKKALELQLEVCQAKIKNCNYPIADN